MPSESNLLLSRVWCNLFRLSLFLSMIKGKELVMFVKANPEMSRTQLARSTGYVGVTKSGKTRVLVQAFYDALTEAQGLSIKNGHPGIGAGKSAQYATTVHKSGIVLVGKAYTAEFGAEPGDVFGIEIREDGIWLPLKERDLQLRKATVPAVSSVPEDEEEELEEEEEDSLLNVLAAA